MPLSNNSLRPDLGDPTCVAVPWLRLRSALHQHMLAAFAEPPLCLTLPTTGGRLQPSSFVLPTLEDGATPLVLLIEPDRNQGERMTRYAMSRMGPAEPHDSVARACQLLILAGNPPMVQEVRFIHTPLLTIVRYSFNTPTLLLSPPSGRSGAGVSCMSTAMSLVWETQNGNVSFVSRLAKTQSCCPVGRHSLETRFLLSLDRHCSSCAACLQALFQDKCPICRTPFVGWVQIPWSGEPLQS
eukprot:Protomagalhaensia_sp_Gyna_25__2714@NODE_2557_length_1017_cov_8_299591_g2122_i0_p1_GENE_NODE_2557_length_1017_cov_8_299591_g2122_i0NODE_2557_length_1017_cov_8_299591_g2122_i0_p1_ORF_typecomplete_len241_score10_24zfC3HC4_3/PF13920_6/2_2e02zfC3HC4_3/PF13920_6/0_039ProkRING_4/PF14447_6/2_8e02ProkRING_4/PF14447_6/0_0069zfRING_6/PF14835_6/0_07Rad50_zn_hook/PF04423_14/14Rad50_zn_hook/PF04423_14/31zfRING_5/PF14634_6/1_7e03zfRING_5/PF14634_6/1_1_NODE_2557_length_1017_cov_8_299591_g2122_i02901012